MLSTALVLPVVDIERARAAFVFARDGSSHIALIPKAEGTKAEHTAPSFSIPSVVCHV